MDLTYTFTLRDDVYFHKSPLFGNSQTRKVTAEDFVYSFNRLKDPKIGSPGGWVLQQIDYYEATSQNEFTIHLKNQFPPFLGLLSMRYCSVVPKEVASFYGEKFRSNPIGTGPFYLKRWDENVKMVLRKNSNYFEVILKEIHYPILRLFRYNLLLIFKVNLCCFYRVN